MQNSPPSSFLCIARNYSFSLAVDLLFLPLFEETIQIYQDLLWIGSDPLGALLLFD